MESSSSMKMIAGAFSCACLKRSRTLAAPTPTIISTNSAALIEKNGTLASPATALANNVFPVPGSPHQQDALGSCTAQTGVLLGSLEEIDDLDQLVLGFIDAGHIVEGDFCILFLVVATGFTPANAHERVPHSSTLLCRAPEEPDIKGVGARGYPPGDISEHGLV